MPLTPKPIGSQACTALHNWMSSALATTVAPSGSRSQASRSRAATRSGSPNRSSWSRKTLVKIRSRGFSSGTSRGSAASSTSNTPIRVPGAASTRAFATPPSRFEPVGLAMKEIPCERSTDWTIEAVVVLPFVPETTTIPSGSAAARRRMNPGSRRWTIRPGTVAPAPILVTRDSHPAILATRATSRSRVPDAPARSVRRSVPRKLDTTRSSPFHAGTLFPC